MASHDPYDLPDITISGALALALAGLIEWASHRTHVAEDVARAELLAMDVALEDAIREPETVRYGLFPPTEEDQ